MKQSRFITMLLLLVLPICLISCGGAGTDKTVQESTDTIAADSPEAVVPVVNTIVTTPQTMLMVLHKVSNFEKFLAVYEAADSLRLANGLHKYVIGRGLRDSNMVLVATKADDLEKAKAFAKGPSLKKAMKNAGVIGTPDISLITTTWQDTVRIDATLRSRTTFSVKDWSAWEKNFADGKQERLDNGITDRAYGHNADDDKKISLVTAVTDTTKAFAYYTSDALKKRRELGGVTGETKRFLFRIVKRY